MPANVCGEEESEENPQIRFLNTLYVCVKHT